MTSNRKRRRDRTMFSALVALCALLLQPAFARSLDHREIPAASPRPGAPIGPTTPAEMEAFIDGFMAAQMRAGPIAGAAVVVVKDGTLFFAKGYGYEDVEKRVPVDPAQTVFRPGSVSKLFTWTAIMQLVEQGKLDLDADVNMYVKDMPLAAQPAGAVTLRNLMTHTAGFEDGAVGYLFADNDKDLVPLRDWLAAHVPLRARPATTDFDSGTNAAYSNWGTALAGRIVEVVSGLPFDDYVEQRIFAPLGMTRSTFREPLPPQLAARMSGGYVFEAGQFERRGFEFIHAAGPAGSMSATATDMARFLIAYLEGGAAGDARILAPETVQLMHTRALSPDPLLNGTALGFYETWINGRRVIGHGGNTSFFHSVFTLLPEARLGLFATINTGGAGARTSVALERAFIDHYFPATLPAVKPPADAVRRNERYAGTYRTLRRSYTSPEKIFAALGDDHVVAMPDGTLYFQGLNDKPARWVEVGEGVFRSTDADVFVAFKGDAGGRATHLVGPFSPMAADRIQWYESTTLHAWIVAIGILLFITTLIGAIRQRRVDAAATANVRWARPALALAGLLLLAFLIGIILTLAGGIEAIIYRIPTTLYVALLFPLLAIPFTLLAVYFTATIWRTRAWRFGTRLHYTLTTLAAVGFLLILHYWNFVGYHFA